MAGVDTLEYLCRGGRLSRASAAIGELANLKPIVYLSPEGKVEVLGKCLGRVKASSFLLKKAGIQIKNRIQIGASIGAHVDPDAFGFAFVTK